MPLFTSGSGGNVAGPTSATDNAIPRYDETTGKLIQNSGVTITDANDVNGSRDINVGRNLLIANVGILGSATFGYFGYPSDGVLKLSADAGGFDRLQFGGSTSSFPALKRSATVLQARLADDSALAPLQGNLRTQANAVAEQPTATHTMIITDAGGTAYRVLCVV